MRKKYYAVYDLKDNCVVVCNNFKELAKWFDKSENSLRCEVSRFNRGLIKYIKDNNQKRYKVFRMED